MTKHDFADRVSVTFLNLDCRACRCNVCFQNADDV